MSILDIIIIGIMVIFSFIGFSRGFLGSILKIFSGLLSLVVSIFLAKTVADFLNSIFNATSFVGNAISGQMSGMDEVFKYTTENPKTGADVLSLIEASGINKFLSDAISSFVDKTAEVPAGTVIGEFIGTQLAPAALIVLSAMGLFITIRITIAILSKIFDVVTKNKAISGLDRFLGFIFGAAKGALIIIILITISSVFMSLPLVGDLLLGAFDDTVIAKPLYEYISTYIADYLNNYDFSSLLSIK